MPKKVEWYTEFVNESYRPSKTDLVVLFYFEPEKVSAIRIITEISENNF